MHNMKENGRIEYKYWPVQNRRSDDYNEVRHILATRDLADTWRYENDPRYLEGSRRAMDWLLTYEVDASSAPEGPMPHPPEGTTLFRYPSYEEMKKGGRPSNQKLGTVAVALLAGSLGRTQRAAMWKTNGSGRWPSSCSLCLRKMGGLSPTMFSTAMHTSTSETTSYLERPCWPSRWSPTTSTRWSGWPRIHRSSILSSVVSRARGQTEPNGPLATRHLRQRNAP